MSEDEARMIKEKIMKKIMSLKGTNEQEQTLKELNLLQRSTEQKKSRINDLVYIFYNQY